MGDFHRVYLFLIAVLRAGYRNCHKLITIEEAHTAIRTVWGRSKQTKNVKRLQREKKNRDRQQRELESSPS